MPGPYMIESELWLGAFSKGRLGLKWPKNLKGLFNAEIGPQLQQSFQKNSWSPGKKLRPVST